MYCASLIAALMASPAEMAAEPQNTACDEKYPVSSLDMTA
jgi:hypothetical protein